MKIGIITPGRSHLLDCAAQFVKNGHDVTFYTMVSPSRCERFGLSRKHVVSFFWVCAPLMFLFRKLKFPGDFNRRIYYWVCRIVDFLAALELKRCDVIISISGCSIKAIRKAKKKFGAKIIIDRGARHILSQNEILSKMPDAEQVYQPDITIEMKQYDMADIIAVPSLHVKESFESHGHNPGKLFINPYGVDLRMFQPVKGKTPKYDVIFVGNWTLQKGADILIEACRKGGLSLLHVGAIGDCPFPKDSDFTHIDPVSQDLLPKYYSMVKVLALPSRQDGFGLVLFQAMACGLPIVYSHNTGGPDLHAMVDHNEYLIEMGSYSSESLADSLKIAIDMRNTIGDNGYLTESDMSRITWEAYGKRYNDFIVSF